jgi:hypothetical protein
MVVVEDELQMTLRGQEDFGRVTMDGKTVFEKRWGH